METMSWSKTKTKIIFIPILAQNHIRSYQKTGPMVSCCNAHQMGKHSDATTMIINHTPAPARLLQHYQTMSHHHNIPPVWILEPVKARLYHATIKQNPSAITVSAYRHRRTKQPELKY